MPNRTLRPTLAAGHAAHAARLAGAVTPASLSPSASAEEAQAFALAPPNGDAVIALLSHASALVRARAASSAHLLTDAQARDAMASGLLPLAALAVLSRTGRSVLIDERCASLYAAGEVEAAAALLHEASAAAVAATMSAGNAPEGWLSRLPPAVVSRLWARIARHHAPVVARLRAPHAPDNALVAAASRAPNLVLQALVEMPGSPLSPTTPPVGTEQWRVASILSAVVRNGVSTTALVDVLIAASARNSALPSRMSVDWRPRSAAAAARGPHGVTLVATGWLRLSHAWLALIPDKETRASLCRAAPVASHYTLDLLPLLPTYVREDAVKRAMPRSFEWARLTGDAVAADAHVAAAAVAAGGAASAAGSSYAASVTRCEAIGAKLAGVLIYGARTAVVPALRAVVPATAREADPGRCCILQAICKALAPSSPPHPLHLNTDALVALEGTVDSLIAGADTSSHTRSVAEAAILSAVRARGAASWAAAAFARLAAKTTTVRGEDDYTTPSISLAAASLRPAVASDLAIAYWKNFGPRSAPAARVAEAVARGSAEGLPLALACNYARALSSAAPALFAAWPPAQGIITLAASSPDIVGEAVAAEAFATLTRDTALRVLPVILGHASGGSIITPAVVERLSLKTSPWARGLGGCLASHRVKTTRTSQWGGRYGRRGAEQPVSLATFITLIAPVYLTPALITAACAHARAADSGSAGRILSLPAARGVRRRAGYCSGWSPDAQAAYTSSLAAGALTLARARGSGDAAAAAAALRIVAAIPAAAGDAIETVLEIARGTYDAAPAVATADAESAADPSSAPVEDAASLAASAIRAAALHAAASLDTGSGVDIVLAALDDVRGARAAVTALPRALRRLNIGAAIATLARLLAPGVRTGASAQKALLRALAAERYGGAGLIALVHAMRSRRTWHADVRLAAVPFLSRAALAAERAPPEAQVGALNALVDAAEAAVQGVIPSTDPVIAASAAELQRIERARTLAAALVDACGLFGADVDADAAAALSSRVLLPLLRARDVSVRAKVLLHVSSGGWKPRMELPSRDMTAALSVLVVRDAESSSERLAAALALAQATACEGADDVSAAAAVSVAIALDDAGANRTTDAPNRVIARETLRAFLTAVADSTRRASQSSHSPPCARVVAAALRDRTALPTLCVTLALAYETDTPAAVVSILGGVLPPGAWHDGVVAAAISALSARFNRVDFDALEDAIYNAAASAGSVLQHCTFRIGLGVLVASACSFGWTRLRLDRLLSRYASSAFPPVASAALSAISTAPAVDHVDAVGGFDSLAGALLRTGAHAAALAAVCTAARHAGAVFRALREQQLRRAGASRGSADVEAALVRSAAWPAARLAILDALRGGVGVEAGVREAAEWAVEG